MSLLRVIMQDLCGLTYVLNSHHRSPDLRSTRACTDHVEEDEHNSPSANRSVLE